MAEPSLDWRPWTDKRLAELVEMLTFQVWWWVELRLASHVEFQKQVSGNVLMGMLGIPAFRLRWNAQQHLQ